MPLMRSRNRINSGNLVKQCSYKRLIRFFLLYSVSLSAPCVGVEGFTPNLELSEALGFCPS